MPATSTTSDTLEKAWASVHAKSQNGSGYYSIRVFGESICSIFVGQRQPSGLIDFAFEVAPKSIKKITLSQEAKGFEVKVQKTDNAKNSKVLRVSISLNRHSFLDLFKVLAADIVEHCLSAATESEAMTKLLSRLGHWRRFSEKAGDEGLSDQEQTGLFGELRFLRILLDQSVDPVQSLKAWHGPLRDNQDFCFGPLAVEVKASTSNNANQVSISNVRQLDARGLDHLYLYHVSLDRRNGSGDTLPSAIEDLQSRFRKSGSESEDLFEQLLMLQGYHHSQSNLYDLAGYTLRHQQFYEVTPGFPRILECDIVDGVSEVRYKIDLSCASSFKKELKQTMLAIKQNVS
jgi:hypothetical protein